MNLKRQFSHGLTQMLTDKNFTVWLSSVLVRVNPWLMDFLRGCNFAPNIVRRVL